MIAADIDAWINGYKVRVFPWVDGKTIYCNVEYFAPGASLNKPTWDKSVFIKDTGAGRRLAYEFTATLVEYVATMRLQDGQRAIITVEA